MNTNEPQHKDRRPSTMCHPSCDGKGCYDEFHISPVRGHRAEERDWTGNCKVYAKALRGVFK